MGPSTGLFSSSRGHHGEGSHAGAPKLREAFTWKVWHVRGRELQMHSSAPENPRTGNPVLEKGLMSAVSMGSFLAATPAALNMGVHCGAEPCECS